MAVDFHRLALLALVHHLNEAEVEYQRQGDELVVDSHRLSLTANFERFEKQGSEIIAPLDVELHVDREWGDRFRVGTLGVGATEAMAAEAAVSEWHLLAASPVLSALGAVVANRRPSAMPPELAGWQLFAGRAGIRGPMPKELFPGSQLYRILLEALRQRIAAWEEPDAFELRSIFVMATFGGPHEKSRLPKTDL
jgi:hypothetical protein